jgi:hypothetical protein
MPLSGASGVTPPKYHMVYTPSVGQLHGPLPLQQWGLRPPQQLAPHPLVYPQ